MIQCPKCKTPGITIAGYGSCALTLDETGEITETEWDEPLNDEDAGAWCCVEGCGWHGTFDELAQEAA